MSIIIITITHSHHVVTLHVRLVLVLAHVVELAEEVEGDDGVEVHDHGQQPHRHHQLQHTHTHTHTKKVASEMVASHTYTHAWSVYSSIHVAIFMLSHLKIKN